MTWDFKSGLLVSTKRSLSPWAPLVRAALFASKGDELNSAREYTRAAELFAKLRNERNANDDGVADNDDNDSALALPVALYRKSLIHYAHAKSWAEAVDLLQRVPALKTAITERFKLYLHVCHKALTDTNAASRLVRKHVQIRTKVTEEDVEGNLIERTKTTFDEEELDVLEVIHSKSPPASRGPVPRRVMAASTHIDRDLRRTRTQHQHQFRQAMQASSPSLDEIYEVAKNAAEESGFEGLMYLGAPKTRPSSPPPLVTDWRVSNKRCSRSTKTTFQFQSVAFCTTSTSRRWCWSTRTFSWMHLWKRSTSE